MVFVPTQIFSYTAYSWSKNIVSFVFDSKFLVKTEAKWMFLTYLSLCFVVIAHAHHWNLL